MQPLASLDMLSPWTPGIFTLIFFAATVFVIVGFLLFVSSWLGANHPSREKLIPYESGIRPTGSARLRYPIPFFLVAIFFLIFDVEGAFIFTWASAVRDLGWAGWGRMTFFILVLLAGLVYIWRKGGLEWGPDRTRR